MGWDVGFILLFPESLAGIAVRTHFRVRLNSSTKTENASRASCLLTRNQVLHRIG